MAGGSIPTSDNTVESNTMVFALVLRTNSLTRPAKSGAGRISRNWQVEHCR